MPIPVLLDTDIGDDVDDVFALLLAARVPDVSLEAVTTVFGDTQARARIARKVLDLDGRPEIPVAAGHRTVLSGRDPSGGPGATMISAEGFVGAPGSPEWDALGARLHPRGAVDLLLDRIEAASEPPVLAAIGPLTNVADLFRRAPQVVRRLRAVVLMGGRLGPDAEKGEHNFNCDPEATRIVLESGATLKIGTIEITSQARIGAAELPRLRAGTPACAAAAEQLALYLQRRNRSATSMYDPLALTLAYTDRYLRTEPVALRVSPSERSAIISVEAGAAPAAQVSVGVDTPAFVEHLLGTIGA